MWPTPRPAESHGRHAPGRRLAVAALIPAMALSTAACGGDGKSAGGGTSSPAATPSASAGSTPPSPVPKSKGGDGGSGGASPQSPAPSIYNAFARCMRKQGVHVPDAGQTYKPPSQPDPATAQKALAACANLLRSPTASPR